MNDLLLSAGKNPLIKKILTEVGVPTPVALKRQSGALSEIPLKDQRLAFVTASGKTSEAVLTALAEAGANIYCEHGVAKEIEAHLVAFGRQIRRLATLEEKETLDALVFDGSAIQDIASLESVYEFFHEHLRRLATNGRVVIIATTPANGDLTYVRALEGFMRSLAKEIGARGATANLIIRADAADDALLGPLAFFLSRAACYVTGQVLPLAANAQKPKEILRAQSLKGKVALVTGAARGIGAEIAQALALEGAHVVCLDRSQEGEALAATARKIDSHIFYQDLSEASAAEKISAYFTTKFKGCDIVVHNAGITLDKTLKNMPVESWRRVMDINLRAPMAITRRMVADKSFNAFARVVCLSSIAGVAGNFGQTNYAASKAALRGFVAAMAPELAKNGATINAVAPGFIETKMTASIPFFTREVGRRLNNLGQGGQPQDVAQVVAFLTQPAAYAVNGQTLRICGGSLLGA